VRLSSFEIEPLASAKLDGGSGKAKQNTTFQAMKSNGAVDCMRFYFRSCANNQANRFKQFGFCDGGRSGMAQLGAQRTQIDNLTRPGVAYRH
jgi:hypothetical protein